MKHSAKANLRSFFCLHSLVNLHISRCALAHGSQPDVIAFRLIMDTPDPSVGKALVHLAIYSGGDRVLC
jgi:hypothetical protein